MHIINKHSNLTPTQDLKVGAVKSMYRVFDKKGTDKRNNTGGLSEHACHFTTPYTCVATVF